MVGGKLQPDLGQGHEIENIWELRETEWEEHRVVLVANWVLTM